MCVRVCVFCAACSEASGRGSVTGVCFQGLFGYRPQNVSISLSTATAPRPVVGLPRIRLSVTEQSECSVFVFRL